MKQRKRGLVVIVLLVMVVLRVNAQQISGQVTDGVTKEPLVGAIVKIIDSNRQVVTDADGYFMLNGLDDRSYDLLIRYMGYQTKEIDGVRTKLSSLKDGFTISMKADEQHLNDVIVTGVAKRNTQTAAIQQMKNSSVIVSNISAQEINRTQDSNAGEVIRRIPGVSLIDDKFVMVRGLSQRYNNVWINGSAVPSSEADSRAFSFDMIPSSQMDNLTIVKAPAAEYPADYSGGFILIDTKGIPVNNHFSVSVGGNWNDATVFRNFIHSKSSSTDFLGFDGGLRSMRGGIDAKLNGIGNEGGTDLMGNGLNNNWRTKTLHPFGDLKLGASANHHWNLDGQHLGMIASLNYTNEYRTYKNMQNNLFGVYDAQNDRPNYLRHSMDDQYNHNVRLGAMFNLTLLSKNGNNKYELKNIFNQLANDRYTWRSGISAQANLEKSAEYYYRTRTVYNGQLTGKYTRIHNALDWSVGYAYANRHLPDRRRYITNDALERGVFALSNGSDVSCEWTQLNEHIFSVNVNERHDFLFGSWKPFMKMGAYGEYRTRKYFTRDFIYSWNADDNTLPSDFRYKNITELLSDPNNFGADKLYLLEESHFRNNYRGHNTLGAGYLTVSLPFERLNVYAGVRFEHNDMELISNTKDNVKSETSRHYRHSDAFPSVNAIYELSKKNQLRFSYGKSINRPEFREVSSSVFYDFDLASSVEGNTELKNCYVHNLDLRYEFYPSHGEVISLAAFYKHFKSPIEWTYTVSGGTDLIYSYKNAKNADSYGLELDVKKDLSFLGLPGFSCSFNGALIRSRVKFTPGDLEENRPMQGQSPYLINTGLFYHNESLRLDLGILYNRIGKRLIGVGRSEGTTGDETNARVPDSYEMPRDMLDLSASKKFGSHLELKFNIRDLFNEKVNYRQFAKVTSVDHSYKTVKEMARSYTPGRDIGFTAIYQF